MHHRMPPSKTGCTSLNMIFPPVMHLDLDDPKQWPPQDIIDQIHKLISEDHQILPKSIAEQLGISHGWAGSIIHEDLDMQKLSTKWVPRCLNADQKRQLCKFWNFFSAIQMISCCDWWPWMKTGYITITQRKSNNQQSGGIVAHPTPKNAKCKNLLEKFSPRFFGIKTAPPHWSSTKGPNYQRGVLLISAWCLDHPHYSPDLWPHQTTICSLDRKNSWKLAIFRPTWRSLLPRRPGWTDNLLNFFWVACKS